MRYIILLSLIPIVVAFALRKLFYREYKNTLESKTQIPLHKACGELLPPEIEVAEGKRFHLKGGIFYIPAPLFSSKEHHDHLHALPLLGLTLLGKGKPLWLDQEKSLLSFETLFPVFSFVILIFGVFAKSIPPPLAVGLLFMVLGLTCLNALYLTWIRHNSIELIIKALPRISLYFKSDEQEAFLKALKAQKYKYVLPKFLSWLA